MLYIIHSLKKYLQPHILYMVECKSLRQMQTIYPQCPGASILVGRMLTHKYLPAKARFKHRKRRAMFWKMKTDFCLEAEEYQKELPQKGGI